MILLLCDRDGCYNAIEAKADTIGRLMMPAGWWLVPGSPGCVACSYECARVVRKPNNGK